MGSKRAGGGVPGSSPTTQFLLLNKLTLGDEILKPPVVHGLLDSLQFFTQKYANSEQSMHEID